MQKKLQLAIFSTQQMLVFCENMLIDKQTSHICGINHQHSFLKTEAGLVWFMVLNATFNNISAISWQSVLLVEETGVPEENHRPVASRNHELI